MGNSFLQDLDTREPQNIIMTLFEPNSGFKEALVASQDNPDKIKLLLSVLAKACSTKEMPRTLLSIFNVTKEVGFFLTLSVTSSWVYW